MMMKQKLALLLALIMLFALFAGCSKPETGAESTPTEKPTTPATAAPAQSSGSTPVTSTPEPVEEGPYKFAPGKYEVDEQGWPTSGYQYETPICTSGETLTYWTVNFTPQYLPEGGLNDVPFRIEEAERTGVNIEYIVIASTAAKENFSALLAADDLPHMLSNAVRYYPGNKLQSIEDGYFVNIYEYKEYAPNYFYLLKSKMGEDPDFYDFVFLDDTHVIEMKCVDTKLGMNVHTVQVRGDWCREIGYDYESMTTYDDLEELAMLLKTQYGAMYPTMLLTNTLDWGALYSAFDCETVLQTTSYPSPTVKDGKVDFFYTDNSAKVFLEKCKYWYDNGFVRPDFVAYDAQTVAVGGSSNNKDGGHGIIAAPGTNVATQNANSDDPDCDWQVIRKPVLYDGQVLHLGKPAGYGEGRGATQISTNCPNIPLAVTWMDWRYCDEGSDLASYGVEGVTWEYDQDGNKVTTEWAYKNPDGWNWGFLMMTHAMNFFMEHGLKIIESTQFYPGGSVIPQYFETHFDVPNDGAYAWPRSIVLDTDQAEEFRSYSDISTYIEEHVFEFIYGERPFSDWEAVYMADLEELGLREAEAVYQEAYDAHRAKVEARGF